MKVIKACGIVFAIVFAAFAFETDVKTALIAAGFAGLVVAVLSPAASEHSDVEYLIKRE